MRYGSLFSGIEAASLAWRPLGWTCAWVAEIDPFCRALLRHHYPDVPNLGDVTKVDWDAVEPVDVIVGGSPCQSFSVAGRRLGLDDPRGNLALVMLRIVQRVRPRWVLYENVPGLLLSDEGRDFGAFLGLLGELGFGFAYRVLDAQHGGVPQRRRRLWVVGHSGGQWQRAAAVLFDEQSLHGDPPPGRETRQNIAADTGNGLAFGGNNTAGPIEVATACNAHGGLDFESETFITSFSSKDHGADAGDTAPTLRAMGHDGSHANGGGQVAVAFHQNSRDEIRTSEMAAALSSGGGKPGQGYPAVAFTVSEQANGFAWESSAYPTLQAHPQSESSNIQQGIRVASGVRRLTPVECERLMAMPDDYTLVPYRGKPAADGNRYKAIGNSMVVSEISWLGKRIQMVDEIP